VDAERERNDREWNDPANWKGFRWDPFYYAPEDSRAFVPKRGRRRGYTVNLAHPLGRTAALAILAVALAVLCVAIVTERRAG
jgi:uncharacterized membrane protein